jgi:hypothetical protein
VESWKHGGCQGLDGSRCAAQALPPPRLPSLYVNHRTGAHSWLPVNRAAQAQGTFPSCPSPQNPSMA